MKQRIILGKTGLEVNRLGLGGIPIQRVDENEAVNTVRHAVECGVDFIDTARAYTTSEEVIGKALVQTSKQVVIATKSHARAADEIRKDIDISLKNLRREYIDIYQCHFVKDEQDYQNIIGRGGALEGMRRARDEGLVGHIGFSTHSLDLADRILDDDVFETVMVCFSFLEPKAKKKVIPKAIEKNVAVITMKPFSGGAIDNASLSLKYVLSQPGIVAIPGVETQDLFDENWAVFSGNYQLNAADRQAIEEIRSRYDKSFCRRCDYCQPCTEDIPIQIVLGIRYAVKRFGDGFLLTGWGKDAVDKARQCTECGECMTRCPYELPIPELIKANLKWVDETLKRPDKLP
ncbi:MAG: aldo/keto reductase [Desulfobacteraceae bacterium]|jgi:predicted aldo/keto reductase-like oxidoreductase